MTLKRLFVQKKENFGHFLVIFFIKNEDIFMNVDNLIIVLIC